MNLVENMMDDCVIMEKRRSADGAGGLTTEWYEGAEFKAAVVLNSSLEAQIAEKQGVTSIYTVTTHRNASLDFHDTFKRKRDGKIFRVTSDGGDVVSPSVSTLNMSNVTAEKWSLTQ